MRLKMGSADRKLKRKQKRKKEKDIGGALDLFDLLGDQCEACEKPYDKKDKEMVSTWSVVVRKKEKVVRLYCPECWQFATNLIKEVEENDE